MVPARRKMRPPDLDVTPAFRRWRLRPCPAQPLSTAQYASLEPQFQVEFPTKCRILLDGMHRILHSKISKIMAFLTEQELESLRIDQSVFHIVGRGEEHFQVLTAFDDGGHAAFFLGRVRSVNSGNRYEFLEDAPVWAQLARIPARPLRRLDSCAISCLIAVVGTMGQPPYVYQPNLGRATPTAKHGAFSC